MEARRFERIFEECLSAYLEGRRSVEESLSLYPSLAHELEPLLRTSAELSSSLAYQYVPPHLQESVRERFMAAAAARRRQRIFGARPQPVSGWRWALMAPVAVVAVAAALAAGITFLPGGGGGPDSGGSEVVSVDVSSPTPSGALAADLSHQISVKREQVKRLKEAQAQGQPIHPDVIREMTSTDSVIVAHLQDPAVALSLDSEAKVELASLMSQESAFLRDLVAGQDSQHNEEEVAIALALTDNILQALGVPPSPTEPPAATATAEATPQPVETETPVPTPTETATPPPTPAPTPTLTGTPQPSPTPAPTTNPATPTPSPRVSPRATPTKLPPPPPQPTTSTGSAPPQAPSP